MAFDDLSDELIESMTSQRGCVPPSQQLRDSVVCQTTRIVRFRRRIRRAGGAAILIASYLGGIATVSLWPADRPRDGSVRGAIAELDETREQLGDPNVRSLIRPEDDQVADSDVLPVTTRLSPYERLRRTGDQQLENHDDIQAAIRSYKKALQLASADQRTIAPDRDSWLMMALKQSIN